MPHEIFRKLKKSLEGKKLLSDRDVACNPLKPIGRGKNQERGLNCIKDSITGLYICQQGGYCYYKTPRTKYCGIMDEAAKLKHSF